MKTFFVLFYLIFICCLVSGQTGMPELNTDDYPGLHIKNTRNFSDSSLWGWMDGGADLYYEYGFTALQVTKFEVGEENFILECFKMKDAEAAFGIYSVNHNVCLMSGSGLKFNCQNRYQLQFAKAEYYVSLINERNTTKAKVEAALISRIIANKIAGKEYSLPSYFDEPASLRYHNRIKMIIGSLGLKNGYPDWEELFDYKGKYTAYIMNKPLTCDTLINVFIKIDKPAELSEFYKKLGFDFRKGQDNYLFAKENKNYYLSVCSCGEVKIIITRSTSQ
ncbi:MAG: hypothetical protein NTW49_02090 [Bacteroidia bacterium]|nr:hypothetical protein [Bacteroidia bacterium]